MEGFSQFLLFVTEPSLVNNRKLSAVPPRLIARHVMYPFQRSLPSHWAGKACPGCQRGCFPKCQYPATSSKLSPLQRRILPGSWRSRNWDPSHPSAAPRQWLESCTTPRVVSQEPSLCYPFLRQVFLVQAIRQWP